MKARPELFEEPENLLEAMLAAQRADPTFTDEEIVANVGTIITAGEDTTAHTLAWTMWLISSREGGYPAAARRGRQRTRPWAQTPFPTDHGSDRGARTARR